MDTSVHSSTCAGVIIFGFRLEVRLGCRGVVLHARSDMFVILEKPEAIAGKCVTLLAREKLACRYSVPPTPSWF